MDVVWFLLLFLASGLVIGGLGRLAVPGPDPMSVGMTILIGIGGSLIAGLVSWALFGRDAAPGVFLSVLGVALLVWIARRMRRGREDRTW